MAKGYWVANVDVRDLEQYKKYVAANAAPFAKYGAKFRCGPAMPRRNTARRWRFGCRLPRAILRLSRVGMAETLPCAAAGKSGIPCAAF